MTNVIESRHALSAGSEAVSQFENPGEGDFVLCESCPTSMRPFVQAYFRVWLLMTATITIVLTPTMSKTSDVFVAAISVFILFGVIALK